MREQMREQMKMLMSVTEHLKWVPVWRVLKSCWSWIRTKEDRGWGR